VQPPLRRETFHGLISTLVQNHLNTLSIDADAVPRSRYKLIFQEATLAGWKSGDVIVNGLKMHYTRTGGAHPPLVLAHGFTDDGVCWSVVAEILAPAYDVIMVDARGHGLSDAPDTGYGPLDRANDLHGVIQALGLNKPAVLGHSMGAITTLTLAASFPEVPSAIMLEDPPPNWMPSPPVQGQESDAEIVAKTRESFAKRKAMTREALIAEQHRASPTWSDAELGPWADSKLRLSLNAAQVRVEGGPTSADWSRLLPRITCPALLITADTALGAIVSPEAAKALKGSISQLRVAHIAHAGHSIHREQLDEFISVVRKFLADCQS